MLKGKRLKPGDTIGVVAPANFASQKEIEIGKEQLEKLGYKTKVGESCFGKWFNFSGNDDLRANDINKMFADGAIDAILCLRGGYGCIRILDRIDFETIRNNSKLFIGFSDITLLLNAIIKYAGLVTIHGPMLTPNISKDSDPTTTTSFINLIEGKTKILRNPLTNGLKILSPGKTEGQIIGGNLSLLVSSLGTKYEIDTKNKILFFEELNEHTYKIDRMLNHLKLANKFDDCAGIIIGCFKNCRKDKPEDFPLAEVFSNVFEGFKKPIITNFQSGHCTPMISIPFGVNCELNALKKKPTIKLLEQPVK